MAASKGLRPGGFGLLLVGKMVDELIYNEAHFDAEAILALARPSWPCPRARRPCYDATQTDPLANFRVTRRLLPEYNSY